MYIFQLPISVDSIVIVLGLNKNIGLQVPTMKFQFVVNLGRLYLMFLSSNVSEQFFIFLYFQSKCQKLIGS